MRRFHGYPEVFGPVDRLQLLVSSPGLAVADGWMPLLDQLCHDLSAVIREDGLDFQATQVKVLDLTQIGARLH